MCGARVRGPVAGLDERQRAAAADIRCDEKDKDDVFKEQKAYG